MKNLLKYVLLLFAASLIMSCEPSCVRDGRRLYKKYYAKMLKDPESLKIYSEKYIEKKNNEVEWTLDIGAKNEFGGMVRKTVHITTAGGVYLTIGDDTFYYWDLD